MLVIWSADLKTGFRPPLPQVVVVVVVVAVVVVVVVLVVGVVVAVVVVVVPWSPIVSRGDRPLERHLLRFYCKNQWFLMIF